ncbi:tRNA ligase class II core domain (G, H, P, S and T) domain-containing protein [Besnoitia besnoiti]|uniref:tRNA ligase class II core domain (G, H, P, S and T) domain-containing protein n=1 Tax=Besnoitia besnoiti TaxID=94643 RepID=A0A2A9MK25_BESBE|nr:tRNA ligase class II core domain (G, H, P, S and T) domain-containing protein [Besnoitia besnoiti]PFH37544.1 tRNA ligase class II core domain (G, H, P, S and T) domain-containing protein [Besnoitia besnoiti]
MHTFLASPSLRLLLSPSSSSVSRRCLSFVPRSFFSLARPLPFAARSSSPLVRPFSSRLFVRWIFPVSNPNPPLLEAPPDLPVFSRVALKRVGRAPLSKNGKNAEDAAAEGGASRKSEPGRDARGAPRRAAASLKNKSSLEESSEADDAAGGSGGQISHAEKRRSQRQKKSRRIRRHMKLRRKPHHTIGGNTAGAGGLKTLSLSALGEREVAFWAEQARFADERAKKQRPFAARGKAEGATAAENEGEEGKSGSESQAVAADSAREASATSLLSSAVKREVSPFIRGGGAPRATTRPAFSAPFCAASFLTSRVSRFSASALGAAASLSSFCSTSSLLHASLWARRSWQSRAPSAPSGASSSLCSVSCLSSLSSARAAQSASAAAASAGPLPQSPSGAAPASAPRGTDHRLLGREMGLFVVPPASDVGAVGPVFLPEGWKVIENLKNVLRRLQCVFRFQEVSTPSLAQSGLWQRSGHWSRYRANMWSIDSPAEAEERTLEKGNVAAGVPELGDKEAEEKAEEDSQAAERGEDRDAAFRLSLKPMSCPMHLDYALPFLLESPSLLSAAYAAPRPSSPPSSAEDLSAVASSGSSSAAAEADGDSQEMPQSCEMSRHLPMRISEFGRVFRRERRSALCGLFRLREFTQDDGHILCTRRQAVPEIKNQLSAILHLYIEIFEIPRDLIQVSLGTRSQSALSSDLAANWNEAESWLLEAAAAVLPAGVEVARDEEGGAFYGPKLDFSVPDGQGRRWQTGTIQVDLLQPQRLQRLFSRRHPGVASSLAYPLVLIHRAAAGSLERFLALLLELRRGDLPLWLAPVKAAVVATGSAGVDSACENYARRVARLLRRASVSVFESGAQVGAGDDASDADAGGGESLGSGDILLDLRPLHLSTKLKDLVARRRVPLVFLVGPREAKTESVTVLTKTWRRSPEEDGKRDDPTQGKLLPLQEAVKRFRDLARVPSFEFSKTQ